MSWHAELHPLTVHLDEFTALFRELRVQWSCAGADAIKLAPTIDKNTLASDLLPRVMVQLQFASTRRGTAAALSVSELSVLSFLVLRLSTPGAMLTWGSRLIALNEARPLWQESCDVFIDPETPHYAVESVSAPDSLTNLTLVLAPAPPMSFFSALNHSFVIDPNHERAVAMHVDHGVPMYATNGSVMNAIIIDDAVPVADAAYNSTSAAGRRLTITNPAAAEFANGARPISKQYSFSGNSPPGVSEATSKGAA